MTITSVTLHNEDIIIAMVVYMDTYGSMIKCYVTKFFKYMLYFDKHNIIIHTIIYVLKKRMFGLNVMPACCYSYMVS